jgi:hypothetical protein
MTAKQKAARAKFKAIVKEAGKLRKKNPKLTQAEAVKQAWAISYGKKRAGVGAVKKKTVTKKKAKPTKVKAKKGKRTSEMHTDTKSHNVNIRVISGVKVKSKELRKQLQKKGYRLTHGYTVVKRKSIGEAPTFRDPDAAREIELFADNDSQLYFQSRKPILANLARKYKKGTYDIDKAAKLWRYYVEAAMKKYNKEFGSRSDKWFDLLDTHDRNLLAREYAIRTKAEFDLGNFE